MRSAALDVLSDSIPDTEQGLRLKEFMELQRAATRGGEPSTGSGTPILEVLLRNVRTDVCGPKGIKLRITPVSRLRVVMAQVGYRRYVGRNDDAVQLVSTLFHEGMNRWAPGVELLGEGIFVDLAPNAGGDSEKEHPALVGNEAATWLSAWRDNQTMSSFIQFLHGGTPSHIACYWAYLSTPAILRRLFVNEFTSG